jgi:hypothetical protein
LIGVDAFSKNALCTRSKTTFLHDQTTGGPLGTLILNLLAVDSSYPSPVFGPDADFLPIGESAPRVPASRPRADDLRTLSRADREACLKEATERLSPLLLHVAHQTTAKSRDRALAALIVLIYGPTPFGGANTLKEVAMRFGMTEQNLHQLVGTLRSLLQSPRATEETDE